MIKVNIKFLIKYYRSVSVPVKAAFWFLLCNIVQKGISMITIPIFTRLLSTEEYGLFSVYQSWYLIIGIFASLNLQDAVFNTGMIKYQKDKNNFTLSLQSLTTLMTLILFIVYLIRINFWNSVFELPTVLMIAMFLEFLFIPAYSFWSAKQKFEYKYITLICSTLFIAIVCPIVAIIAIYFSKNKGVVRILSFAFVQSAVGLLFYILNCIRGKGVVKISYWRYGLIFAIPLIPHYLSMIVLQQADRIMIGRLIGNSEAAIYSIAYNVSQLMLLITKAINNSYIPYTYRCIKEQKYKKLRKSSNALIIFVSGMIIVLMLLAPEIIRFFASTDYYDAIWIIPPVSLSVFLLFLYSMFSNIEFYYEKNGIAMLASIVGAITNIILNYIFIPIFGYIAAGYTTVVCYIIFVIMHYLGMKKVLKQGGITDEVYDIKIITILSVIMFIIMCGVIIIYKYIIIRYIVLALICFVILINKNRIKKFLVDFRNK